MDEWDRLPEDETFAEEGDSDDVESEQIPKEKRVLRTQAYDKSVSDLVAMMDEDIRLDPHYQRNYIWDNKKASLLIESILLNVPIPVVYVEEDEESCWNVVDGLQRLNSLRRFFNNEFKLTGLEVLPELNRLQYSALPPKAQRILKNGILRIIVILQESHPEIKYDIFLRLNRGSVRLNEQELRNCLYRGRLNTFIKELGAQPTFLNLLGLEKPHPRFIHAELALRYIALQANFDAKKAVVLNYSGKMKTFLNWYMQTSRDVSESRLHEIKEMFQRSVDSAATVFGRGAFRRIDPDTGRIERQINRAIYDVIMIGFSQIPLSVVEENKEKIFKEFLDLLRDKTFVEAVTLGTSDKGRVDYRLSAWTSRLDTILKP